MATAAGGRGAPAPTGFERWGRFVERLRAFHRDIERRVPHVSEVTSLVNARYTYGLEDELVVEDLLERWPRGEAELDELRARVLSIRIYRAYLISRDGRLTTVIVELETGPLAATEGRELAGFGDSERRDPARHPGVRGRVLDISTMMIGAILLGVAVDDTIHFMHVFYRYHALGCDAADAIARTLQTTGRAMFFTSVVLAAGFFVQMLATVDNLSHTGALMGFAVAVAFLAGVLLAPALMVTLEPRMAGGGSPADERRAGG